MTDFARRGGYGVPPPSDSAGRTPWIAIALIASILLHLLVLWGGRNYRLNPLPSSAEEFRRSLDAPRRPMRVVRVEDPTPSFERMPERTEVLPPEQQQTELAPSEKASDATALTPLFNQLPAIPDAQLPALPDVGGASPALPQVARQRVMDVLDNQVKTELPGYERISLPQADRTLLAPDIAPPTLETPAIPIKGASLSVPTSGAELFVSGPPGGAILSKALVPTSGPGLTIPTPPPLEPSITEDRFSDPVITPNAETPPPFVPVDDRLQVQVSRYDGDPAWTYYAVQVVRRSGTTLPVLPKDVVIVQDTSASIAEVRLDFCRKGLIAMLPEILRDGDRWQLLAFSSGPTAAFNGWQPVNAETLEKGRQFISGLRSHGSTDLFALLRDLLRLRDNRTRPMVVVVVTDGRPTFGVLESTRIIGEFTRLNKGEVAVYAFGTQRSANRYLLDMLTYCNRGGARVLAGDRWDIPVAMGPLFSALRNPVMHDIRFTFDTASGGEVYPRLTTALFADRPLWLYGRCKKGLPHAVCQIRGRAGTAGYDVVFNLDIAGAPTGTKQIRQAWAEQKMFTLIADYASDPAPAIMEALVAHAGAYQLPIPYRSDLGK